MEVIGKGMLFMILGIVIGVVGMIMMGINYPIYKKILNSSKKKYANDIVILANEISNVE